MISAPIARPGGGFASSIREKELWSKARAPTKEEWEVTILENLIETSDDEGYPSPNISETIVFQKQRTLKLGKKILEFGWKDLPPPKYI